MKERVTQRFLKYVAVDTQSDEASDTFPSTEKQKVLAKMLVEELRRMGVPQVEIDEQYGYGPLPVHFVGKAGTALLMISIVSLIFADLGTNTFFHLLYIAALAAGIWGIAMYWLAGYIYTEQGIRLLRKELGEKYGA